jgi:O-antigen ligase
LNNHFYNIGLKVKETYIEITQSLESVIRASGFFGNGDVNSMGVFFVMLIGFFLSRLEKNSLKFSILVISYLLLALVGIFFSGSRTTLIALASILLIYLLRNFRNIRGYQVILLMVLIIGPSFSLVVPALSRFTEQDAYGTSSRLYKWDFYYQYFMDNPRVFLFGSSEVITPYLNKYKAAHNLFIQTIYNA